MLLLPELSARPPARAGPLVCGAGGMVLVMITIGVDGGGMEAGAVTRDRVVEVVRTELTLGNEVGKILLLLTETLGAMVVAVKSVPDGLDNGCVGIAWCLDFFFGL
jgi:hypothetical protein